MNPCSMDSGVLGGETAPDHHVSHAACFRGCVLPHLQDTLWTSATQYTSQTAMQSLSQLVSSLT